MKKCLKCEYVWLNEYGEPVSCAYGQNGGGAYIGSHCERTKRKIKPLNGKPKRIKKEV